MQLHVRQTARTHQSEQSREHQQRQPYTTDTGLTGQLGLQLFQITTQRFAVGDDRALRFACRHQALQVTQDRTRLYACFLVHLDQGFQLLARCGVLGGRQTQLAAAGEQGFRNFLEGIQVFTQQENSLRAHALCGQKFVGRLADTLSQHHQLAYGRNLRRWRVLLQLQRGDCFSHLQKVRRLAVNQAQRRTDLGQHLLLCQHRLGIFLSTFDQRNHLAQLRRVVFAQGVDAHFIITRLQSFDGLGQDTRAVGHIGEGLRATHHRLRHRLRQTLGLHQRLARGTQLLGYAIGLVQHHKNHRSQHHQRPAQQCEQRALVLYHCAPAQHGDGDQIPCGHHCLLVSALQSGHAGLEWRILRNLQGFVVSTIQRHIRHGQAQAGIQL